MSPSRIDPLRPRIHRLRALLKAGRATEGDSTAKWQASGQAMEIWRNHGDEFLDVVEASLILCTEIGGRPKTQLVESLGVLAEVLSQRAELTPTA